MNVFKLTNVVETIRMMEKMGASDGEMIRELLEFLHEESNGKLLHHILILDDIKRSENEKEKEILRGGLEDAMHGMIHYSTILEDEKQPIKKMKLYDKLMFDDFDGNIAFIVKIAMAYFPDGVYGPCSNNGVRFFNKFKQLLHKHKDKYLNGKFTDWAKGHGYYDYLKLVIEKNNL